MSRKGKTHKITAKAFLVIDGKLVKSANTAAHNIAWQMASRIRNAYAARNGRNIENSRYYKLNDRIIRRIKPRLQAEFNAINRYFK